MSTRPSKKRNTGGNPNTRIQAPIFTDVNAAYEALHSGASDAVIVDANLQTQLDGLELTRCFNPRVLSNFKVPKPSRWEDFNWNDFKGLPGITGGMWHSYATTTHDSVLDSPIIGDICTRIAGTSDWKIRPNRFRCNFKNDDQGYKSAHLEGEHVLKDTTDVGAIFCMTAGRTFSYYEGSRNDPNARELFKKMGGQTSYFVSPSQEQLKPWRRVTIATTKPGQIILFAGSVIHEISRWKPSLSMFISPYNPAEDDATFYQGLSRTKARLKQKQSAKAPPLPPAFRTPGQQRQHPSQFEGMTRRETEIFGSLFNITGHVWPSGKSTFFMHHMMASNAFHPKLLPFCFDANGKYNYEVITPELVKDCPEFDQTYFSKLPLASISDVEIEQMKAHYTGIPAVAWPLVRYWTKDIRKCSPNVCRRRSYI
jgi:hypothetical protein